MCDLTSNVLSKQGPNSKKKKLYEGVWNFQDVWIVHFPWAKSVVNEKREVHQVPCMICIIVEGKENLLAPKLNNL